MTRKKDAERSRKWRSEHPEKAAVYRMRRYGITPEDWEEMHTAQDGKCAICGGPPNGRHNIFHIDHDHRTGKVRGLLCNTCNVGIGALKDSPELLRVASYYLSAGLE